MQPDTVVKPDDALEAAHREALQKLISRTTDQNRKKELLSVLQDVARSSDTPKAVANLSESEQEVRKLEREWLDAYEQHDAAAMDRGRGRISGALGVPADRGGARSDVPVADRPSASGTATSSSATDKLPKAPTRIHLPVDDDLRGRAR